MLLAPGCAHCPAVLRALSALLEEGALARLEVVNVAARPERAAELGVRGVPWVRIGELELEGLHSREELARRAREAVDPAGPADYLAEQIGTGRLDRVRALLRRHPHWLGALIGLLDDAGTELTVRIGIDALIEEHAGTQALRAELPRLRALAGHAEPRVRSDAAHYLALTGDREALAPLEALAGDAQDGVREEAREALQALRRVLAEEEEGGP